MRTKSGRDLFSKYYSLIFILEKVFNSIPGFLVDLLYEFSSLSESKSAILYRYLYCRRYCKSCGKNVFIGKFVSLKNLFNVAIGENVSIHSFCVLDGIGGLTIGANTSIASSSLIYSFNHTINYEQSLPVKYLPLKLVAIRIGSNVWIGCGTKILAGSSIPSNCVVGSGSLISSSLQYERVLYAGSPASLKKRYD